ncbi:4Fe-4S binding protein [Brassicibacter mesophilus]|uniref:4Fe-4S binding protein n=1 Tax=Brassicibacter mesophilus TaxID=745119 RepID=UPI003D19B46C
MEYIKNVAKIEIHSERCTGCGICVNVCPHAVIRIKEGKAFLDNKNRCIECGACGKNCPVNAIEVEAGVG